MNRRTTPDRRAALICVLGVLVFALCLPLGLSQQSNPSAESSTRSFDGFVVKVTLSQRAKATLINRKETLVVFGYFYGAPRRDTPRKYVDDMGEVWVGDLPQAEVKVGEDARFNNIRLNSQALGRIDKQGPLLLINVVSGRKSSKNNLLNCDFYEGSFAKVEGATIPIACKLITE